MSLASIIGLGYSGYGKLNNIPLLLLPSGSPEEENLIKSEGSYHYNPSLNVGQLPARQKRSLSISFNTIVSPKTLTLLKPLTYGWRNLHDMDNVPEVPFTYVVGTEEGFEGTGYVDSVTLTAAPDSFVTMTVDLKTWLWKELGSDNPLTKIGTPVFGPISGPLSGPLLDPAYKPVAGWNGAVITPVISTNAIVQRYSLKLNNNWNYQTLLEARSSPPNPSLITAGNLDVSLEIVWSAFKKDRPLNSGSFQICIGGATPDKALDTIYIDNMVREPRSFEGGGSPNQMVNWQANYFAQGAIPRSN
jgi:hypothetical protein